MSLSFDGSTSIIGTPVSAIMRPSLPFTLACWVKPDVLKVCGFIQTNKTSTTHRGAWIQMNSSSGDIECGYGDNTGTASTDRRSKLTVSPNLISANVWTHVAASFRGSTDMTIYFNGVDAGGNYSGSGGTVAYDGATGGRIGATSGTANFDGLLADFGFWSVSLSDAEVLSMARGVPTKMVRPGSQLPCWPLWDAASPSIDLSFNTLELQSLTAVTVADHAPVGYPFPVVV